MTIGIALFVCIIGGIFHVVSGNGRVAELGRLAFGIGLFVALSGAGQVVALMVQ
jgi:hypothetical protein